MHDHGAYKATRASLPVSLQPRGCNFSRSVVTFHSYPQLSGAWHTHVSVTLGMSLQYSRATQGDLAKSHGCQWCTWTDIRTKEPTEVAFIWASSIFIVAISAAILVKISSGKIVARVPGQAGIAEQTASRRSRVQARYETRWGPILCSWTVVLLTELINR